MEYKGTLTTDGYSTLYTWVYEGCTQKPPLNHTATYYHLLPRMLTDMLRARVIPWKGLDAVHLHMRLFCNLFKYIDRFFVKKWSLDELPVCLERAYLEGNPDKVEPPTHYQPALKDEKGRVYDWNSKWLPGV
jgi:hypothetical protein